MTDLNITADELRQFIEQYESLDAEKRGVMENQKEVLAEAKSRGFDTRILKMIVKLRKMNPADVQEQDMILETYKSALGMN